MDLSKLPKLSRTDKPQDEGANDPEEAPQDLATTAGAAPAPNAQAAQKQVAPMGLAEAWISIAIGVILLLVFPNTLHFLTNPTAFQQNNPVTDGNGNAIPYLQSVFFWSDLGVTVFAATLVIEGIVLASTALRPLLMPVFVLTLAAAVFNVFVILHVYDAMGLPVVCALGVAVLVYMAITQWRIIQWRPSR
jgi:hypothetical protein